MSTSIRGRRSSAHLDVIRWIAAFEVLLGHTRSLFFRSYYDLQAPGPLTKVFYLISAFSNEAVISFFVLSGYFITSSVIRDMRLERWRWDAYLANRTVRLMIVLLPGLLLTFIWDRASLGLFGQRRFAHNYHPYLHLTFETIIKNTSPSVFLGNCAFLQTLIVPHFGSNSPLWSLSNEFWYYILLPCLCLMLARSSRRSTRLVHLAVFIAIAMAIGLEKICYFVLFLMGALVARADQHRAASSSKTSSLTVFASCVAFLVILVPFRLMVADSAIMLSDFVIGAAFSFLTYTLLGDTRPASGAYARSATLLAGFSYSLYIFHMPILVFLRNWLIPGRSWSPDLPSFLKATVIVVSVLIYAFAFSRLTEAKTEPVRRVILGSFVRHRDRGLRNPVVGTLAETRPS
jgi:peptidoglycan/LPS O-acetylase OafA/YrhL